MTNRNDDFVAALKELEGLSPEKTMAGLDAILEKLPDADKARFAFFSHQMDPRFHAFQAGHAITRTAATLVPFYINPAFGLISTIAAIVSTVVLRGGADKEDCSEEDPKDNGLRYPAIDVEYVQWRLCASQVTQSHSRSFAAGLINGLKHNGPTALVRTAVVLAAVIPSCICKSLSGKDKSEDKDAKVDGMFYVPGERANAQKSNASTDAYGNEVVAPRNIFEAMERVFDRVVDIGAGTSGTSTEALYKVEKIITRKMLKKRAANVSPQSAP